MIFGFGFNKAKVLTNAEKFVKQGKLHNAIAEYEKIVKEEPTDLTVLNTLGDLYARVGNVEKATEAFCRVGDAYAADGFIVKAIAMYKKLTKQAPHATAAILKLAEFYTQQGLYNDARQQYLAVAEQHMRRLELEQAAVVYKRIVDLDPDSGTLQTRLAELYMKLGRTAEARDIYYRCAENLQAKGSLQAAEDALACVLKLEPGLSKAMLMRGLIRLEADDAKAAVEYLEQVPDIDSRPEGLRALLKAHLKMGQFAEADPVARKLLTVFNDPQGIRDYAEALMAAGLGSDAIRFYREHIDTLLTENAEAIVGVIRGFINRVKDDAPALQMICEIFQKAGDNSHLNEVHELLAHACVKNGEMTRARDLFQRLAEEEPENPSHQENYRQLVAQLGDRAVTIEQPKERSILNDDLECGVELREPEYDPGLAEARHSALTDADLYQSYKIPAKAIAPLEEFLELAPRDPRVNLLLGALYTSVHRFAEAAERCLVLASLYQAEGHPDVGAQFEAKAADLRERAGIPAGTIVVRDTAEDVPAVAGQETGVDWFSSRRPSQSQPAIASLRSDIDGSFFMSRPKEEWEEPKPVVLPVVEAAQEAPSLPASSEAAVPDFASATAVSQGITNEIDLSAEWDQMLAEPESAMATPARPVVDDVLTLDEAPSAGPALSAQVAGLLEEARFYLSQSMLEEARAALNRCADLAPDLPAAEELRRQLLRLDGAGMQPLPDLEILSEPPAPEAELRTVPVVENVFADLIEPGFASMAPPPAPEPAAAQDDLLGLTPEPASVLCSPAQTEATAPSATGDDFVLSDVFAAFKNDMERDEVSAADQDADAHYNLAVAFREMGLLDEAIGELQKVCQVVDRGGSFSQIMQAYTWLADCFVQKGVPEAGVRWYEKALCLPQVDNDTSTAIHYELACAYEAAGNRSAALNHFMEVYGTNIDYRDVAVRIQSLKS